MNKEKQSEQSVVAFVVWCLVCECVPFWIDRARFIEYFVHSNDSVFVETATRLTTCFWLRYNSFIDIEFYFFSIVNDIQRFVTLPAQILIHLFSLCWSSFNSRNRFFLYFSIIKTIFFGYSWVWVHEDFLPSQRTIFWGANFWCCFKCKGDQRVRLV